MVQISIRELHRRTGEWLRRVVEEEEILVTDRGKPVATIVPPKGANRDENPWDRRTELPEFQKLAASGNLKSARDSTAGISEDRD